MADKHLSIAELRRLADGEEPPSAGTALVAHLASCHRCRGQARSLPPPAAQKLADLLSNVAAFTPASSAAYSEAFANALARLDGEARRIERTRAAAPVLLEELLGHPADRRILLIRNAFRFQSWGLAELLLAEAKRLLAEAPADAEHFAQLALEVCYRLEQQGEGLPFVQDLEARAWGFTGTARRLRSDLAGSAAAFVRAEEHLAQGSADPLERAQLIEQEAALLRSQRRFEESAALLHEAIRVYRRCGEPQAAGRALISQAKLVGDSGNPAEAIPLLHRAAALIDASADPRLMLCVQQNLLVFLADARFPEEAAALLPQVRRLAVRCGTRTDLLRLHWLGGRVAASLGQYERAEASLLKAREGFLGDGNHFDVALICLDLALVYLGQNRSTEARQLAEHSVPYFEAAQVHREAMAGVLLLSAASKQQELTVRHIEELTLNLRRAMLKLPHGPEP